jgi:hypothetical protein
MLPSVGFCGLDVTRLIIGANPFGGYSHQSQDRNEEMRAFYTVDRIKETWAYAEQAGINTMITNNETPHVLQAVREYLNEGGSLQWIAQVNRREKADMANAVAEVVNIGCKAIYFHGALVDDAYEQKNENNIRKWCDTVRSHEIPVGVAGHSPEAHFWVNTLDIVDFHAVCFFNCGSLHDGKGTKFKLSDIDSAVKCIGSIEKPCIGYKIMGAGRINPQMAFEYAFDRIKPTDVVNVGMYRGDNDNMVEENADIVRETLGVQESKAGDGRQRYS